MPKYYYHGTTVAGHEAIQKSGCIKTSSGNTYTNKVFLAGNDAYAKRITYLKHSKLPVETVVVYKIPKYLLKKKLLGDGSKHVSKNITFGDKTFTYDADIPLHDDIWIASQQYYLNLPEGVSIVRDGAATGLSFSKEAEEKYLK